MTDQSERYRACIKALDHAHARFRDRLAVDANVRREASKALKAFGELPTAENADAYRLARFALLESEGVTWRVRAELEAAIDELDRVSLPLGS